MRAKPMFTYSLIAAALAFNGHALALGLGKITVESALGQPLSARIELTSVGKDDLDSLRAKVADPALYKQNNLTYQAALSQARVTLVNAGGAPYLRVNSPVAVLEPFLDLLVELDWSSGRVVREYTFLLDPPGMRVATGPAPAVTAPVVAAVPPQARPVASPAPSRASAGSAGSSGGHYTVHRGDTLRDIANQFKPDRATLDQMLDALFRANPEAFIGANMNRLRADAVLTLPTEAQVMGTSTSEATKVVHAQAVDWRTYRERVAAAAPVAGGAATRASSGKIGVAVEDKTPAAAPGSDQLKVSGAPAPGQPAAVEDRIASEQQLKDADARIAQLEKTVADMQRALELKNQTLAQLQSQVEGAKGAPAAGAPATPPSAAPAAEGTSATAPAAPVAAAAPAAAGSAPAQEAPPAAGASAPAEAAKPAAESAPAGTAAHTEAAAAGSKAATTPPSPAAHPDEAPGFFADLVSNTPTWALGAGALVILGGIAGLIAARRKTGARFEDSIISGTDMKTNTVFGSTGGGVVNTGENSLASDFSREGLGNIDTDEVDPIAEAEVYLAYGRDAQAEEILKDALKKDPQRQEIYLKLLEIHSQHNKPSAFEIVASELFAVSHGQGDVWHKAMTLGRQLDPANPMFQDDASRAESGAATTAPGGLHAEAKPAVADARIAATAPQAAVAPAHASASNVDALDWAEPSFAPDIVPAGKSAADILAGAESALARSASTPVAAVEAAADRTRGAGVAGAAGAATAAAALGTALEEAKSSFGTVGGGSLDERVDDGAAPHRFDLDFHLDEPVQPAPVAPLAQPHHEPMLNPEGAHLASVDPAPAEAAAPLDLDKLDLHFEPTHAQSAVDPTPSVMDGQWHDAATKLDLAKAYQEMGDREGARDILQEVLHEGDDQQKSEAQALLAKLA